MTFNLQLLPFAKSHLSPFISEETIDYHYNKHHKAYAENLNKLIIGTEFEHKSLIDIIKTSSGSIFNNAAQIWNHTFYWNCLQPHTNEQLPVELKKALDENFSSVSAFKEAFTKEAIGLFGSGWIWLIQDTNNKLSILSTNNANNTLVSGHKTLLTCDVWEHAYYIDYRNARAKYLEAFWNIVNWDFVGKNFSQTS